MSFSTGGLFRRESVTLAELFQQSRDWDVVKEKVRSENILQSRTVSSSNRQSHEIIERLKTLSPQELDLLVETDSQGQGYLLWLGVCRRYRFIAEFAIKVLRERYISLQTELRLEDFDVFYNRKSEWHPELDQITSATRKKLRQVLFKMLREADLLSADYVIHAAMLSPKFLQTISADHRGDLQFFPVFESDLKEGGGGL